jgi:transposase
MRKQKSATEMGFTHHDVKKIRTAIKQCPDKRTYLRLQSVLWIAEGMEVPKVAELNGLSLKSIYNHINWYLYTHKPVSLADAFRSGRPPVAACITDKRIALALQCEPFKMGYRTTTWTVRHLADYLNRKYNCFLSERTLRRRMKTMGLRFKRPKYVYAEKDPNRSQKKGRLYES